MALPPGIIGDAFPRGDTVHRHWLSRTWNPTGRVALVIGINPNTATEENDDGMTGFLTRHLRKLKGEFACGSYILVNCCDLRGGDPKKLRDAKEPCTAANTEHVQAKLCECDFVVASWGTTDYGDLVQQKRVEIANLVRESGRQVICFSPRGLPIYCSQTSANSVDGRWSDTPVPWQG
ncbi:MAG: DUF1643 domain-containing protein [Pirellulales bacterium]|nr:DUF1643 domain-containing protein [Pirellulales bacterium]